ncbi:MAG: DnaD domain protein, partial [Oscillospiraceae bacterium]
MYKVLEANGDAVRVPQLVFAKLTAPGADDKRFRVALYALTQPEVEARQAAEALHIKLNEAERALEYWEGAGLLERVETALPEVEMAPRRRLTTAEVARAAGQDAVLPFLFSEIQRIFGGVVSQADYNVLSTLYLEDKIPADLILLGSAHSAAQGKASARYIEKLLLSWRREGIVTCQQADQYLQTLEQRRKREQEVAKLLGLPAETFTLAERRKIAAWYEEYGYGEKMIEAARLAAGDKQNDIGYLNGILRKWHGKGYAAVQDMQQAEGARNLRVQGSRAAIAPEDDILMNATGYVPLQR